MNRIVTRAGEYKLILTIYIDIVNIYDIDIGIDIEFQPGTILMCGDLGALRSRLVQEISQDSVVQLEM